MRVLEEVVEEEPYLCLLVFFRLVQDGRGLFARLPWRELKAPTLAMALVPVTEAVGSYMHIRSIDG